MLIDLERGYIDAYDFKLTSKNIYLNANPNNENDYFIRIGHDGNAFDSGITENEPTNGFIGVKKNGDMYIKATYFELTYALG
jgi:hypothetical protein